MTNVIIQREDGYGLIERPTDILVYVPIAMASVYSPHFQPHGTEQRDANYVYWTILKSNDAGVALAGSVFSTDVKAAFKLTPTANGFPPPAALPLPLVMPPAAVPTTKMLLVSVPTSDAPSEDYRKSLIRAAPDGLWELVDYSAKSFALITTEAFGKANAETFSKCSGRFNDKLRHYLNGSQIKGWIFSKSNRLAVQMLSNLAQMDLTSYLNGITPHDWSKDGGGASAAGGAVVSIGTPVRTQLQAIGSERTVPQVVSELISMLSRTPEVSELEIPHAAGDVRKAIWGPASEVETRYVAIQHDHPGVPITTEITANINTSRLMVLTWSET